MAIKYDPNALWEALNEYVDEDIFQVYPKLLAELFIQEEAARQEGDHSEAEKLVLPSDKEYRLIQYFSLVELQKEVLDRGDDVNLLQTPAEDSPEEWAPWDLVLPTKNPKAPAPVAVKTGPGPAWDIGQVLKAARLFCKPPMPVNFVDEQEMRCVYSLIYDVFRYKSILDQAIEDTEFLQDYPEFSEHRHCLWLFLMELARRGWGARTRSEMQRATKLLEEAGTPFKNIENVVWAQRVHFAAAIARIRIKNRAFTLSELLPAHLREERMTACVNKETVTGWVNTFKAKKVAQLVKKLHDQGYTYSNSRQLCAGEYRFDRVCPRFITLRPPKNENVGQLELIKDGIIVLQEREFCEGASTLCRALRDNSLQGVVAQTHAASPRCSAYLAAQLRELAAVFKAEMPPLPATPQLGKLVVFGAGDKVASYVCALRELGIDASEAPQSGAPVLILSESVHCDTPSVVSALDGVVAVLATPPNSYSAVTDPIDLVCGRGGDLAMLEVLTESEIDKNGKARVQLILEEQKRTLKTLMSKPQIQLILYETHSALEAENQAQVTRAVAEANRLARERHMLLKKKHRIPSPQKHAISALDKNATASSSSLDTTPRSNFEQNEHSDDVIMSPTKTSSRPTSSSRRNSNAKSMTGSRPGTGSTPPDTEKTKPPSANALKKPPNDIQNPPRSTGPVTTKARPIPVMPEAEVPHDPDKDNPDIFVPSCDLFEIRNLPNLGNGLDIDYILDRDGCYLGLIQRKEITRLDAKYMIKVAEERGLFGQGAPAPQAQRRKRDASSPKRRRRKPSFEVERVGAPTYASLCRSVVCGARGAGRAGSGGAAGGAAAGGAGGAAAGGAGGAAAGGAGRRGSAPAWLDAGPVCEKHARRHAAAAAITAAQCTCHARHRYRRVSMTSPSVRQSSEPPCRRPFPLVVQDLRLNTAVKHQQIGAS